MDIYKHAYEEIIDEHFKNRALIEVLKDIIKNPDASIVEVKLAIEFFEKEGKSIEE